MKISAAMPIYFIVCLNTIHADSYVRVLPLEGQTSALQTATQIFTHPGKPVIHLVAQSHIGTGLYFNNLQQKLDSIDLVIIENARDRMKMRDSLKQGCSFEKAYSASPMGLLAYELGLQLVHTSLDDRSAKFVNADLPYLELQRADGVTCQTVDCFEAEFDRHFIRSLEIADATDLHDLRQKFVKMDSNVGRIQHARTALAQDPLEMHALAKKAYVADAQCTSDLQCTELANSMISDVFNLIRVEERNNAAMGVLADEQHSRQFDQRNSTAIYYGALHMPDFEKRLKEQGYEHQSTQWNTVYEFQDDGTQQ